MNSMATTISLLENSADPAIPDSGKTPAHLHAYRRLREGLLFGEFAPGQSLTIQGLVDRTGDGMTPVREALRRLTSEGAVEMLGNRRLIVPRLTRARAEEVLFLRSTLEPELARRAAGMITRRDIDRLRSTDTHLNAAIRQGDVPGYLGHNYRFHTGLFASANAPMLSDVVERLWLGFGPSMRVICGRFGTLNLPDKHAEILAALEARDADAAATAMREDVEQGMKLVLEFSDSIDAE